MVIKNHAGLTIQWTFLGSSSSSDCKDDVLQNVKFKDETLTRMQDKKNQLVKRSSLEKKEEHLGMEYF